ncbi:CBS domain-containing protein [Haloarcula sp. S1CR25-12]|uniref:CBS domain-containing protein n=1 Tax=Haloarcula saliterrae TaxID=2950534 RepID=A0ABU2FFB8_9EURY|nr:CBS domain-containing protein [Haloarcula sp. S1CR25-12]MDS0260954.1 CBS domain-containing protein [Haloarcula sp. S1CR25-12]
MRLPRERFVTGSNRSDLRMRVEQLVREGVASVGRDAPVRESAETMFDRAVGSVVVVDERAPVGEKGELVGILTLDDVFAHLAGESARVAAPCDDVPNAIRSACPG